MTLGLTLTLGLRILGQIAPNPESVRRSCRNPQFEYNSRNPFGLEYCALHESEKTAQVDAARVETVLKINASKPYIQGRRLSDEEEKQFEIAAIYKIYKKHIGHSRNMFNNH